MKSQIIAFLIATAILLGLIWLTQAHANDAEWTVTCCEGQARPDCWSCTPVPTVTP